MQSNACSGRRHARVYPKGRRSYRFPPPHHLLTAQGREGTANMQVKGGRLEFLTPHLLRGQLLRPGFVRLSLRLGFAQQMPAWSKLQFTNSSVDPDDLAFVLSRIHGLESWADEWESLGRAHEQGARDALALGRPAEAARRYL